MHGAGRGGGAGLDFTLFIVDQNLGLLVQQAVHDGLWGSPVPTAGLHALVCTLTSDKHEPLFTQSRYSDSLRSTMFLFACVLVDTV